MKLFRYFFLLLLLYTPAINSKEMSVKDECLVELIKFESMANGWINAREVKRLCACISNRRKQGLEEDDCPQYSRR